MPTHFHMLAVKCQHASLFSHHDVSAWSPLQTIFCAPNFHIPLHWWHDTLPRSLQANFKSSLQTCNVLRQATTMSSVYASWQFHRYLCVHWACLHACAYLAHHILHPKFELVFRYETCTLERYRLFSLNCWTRGQLPDWLQSPESKVYTVDDPWHHYTLSSNRLDTELSV